MFICWDSAAGEKLSMLFSPKNFVALSKTENVRKLWQFRRSTPRGISVSSTFLMLMIMHTALQWKNNLTYDCWGLGPRTPAGAPPQTPSGAPLQTPPASPQECRWGLRPSPRPRGGLGVWGFGVWGGAALGVCGPSP